MGVGEWTGISFLPLFSFSFHRSETAHCSFRRGCDRIRKSLTESGK